MPKFEVPEELDNLDEVPEKFHPLYTAKEGGGFVYSDPKALKATNHQIKVEKTQIQGELRDVRAELDGLKKSVDPVKYKRLLDKEKELEEAEIVAEGRLEEVKTRLREDYAAKEKDFSTKLTTTQKRFGESMRDHAIEAALAGAGATDTGMKHLRKLLAGDITIVWEDDNPTLRILDEHSKARFNKDADPMTVGDLVKQYRDDLPGMFSASGRGGSGAGGGEGGLPANQEEPSKWSPKERHAWIEKNSTEAYLKLVNKERISLRKKKNAA